MKTKDRIEGNLVSWKLIIDKNNNYITELSFLKDEDIDKIFNYPDKEKVKVLVGHVKKAVAPLHEQLQDKVK
jgi:hypothetical protein